MIFIISSVKLCQPILLWLAAFQASTVKIAFKSNTHCFAQETNLHSGSGFVKASLDLPKSDSISLNIFFKLGANFV
jgi:hypothetical protein